MLFRAQEKSVFPDGPRADGTVYRPIKTQRVEPTLGPRASRLFKRLTCICFPGVDISWSRIR
jgi:hypothetical protein